MKLLTKLLLAIFLLTSSANAEQRVIGRNYFPASSVTRARVGVIGNPMNTPPPIRMLDFTTNHTTRVFTFTKGTNVTTRYYSPVQLSTISGVVPHMGMVRLGNENTYVKLNGKTNVVVIVGLSKEGMMVGDNIKLNALYVGGNEYWYGTMKK